MSTEENTASAINPVNDLGLVAMRWAELKNIETAHHSSKQGDSIFSDDSWDYRKQHTNRIDFGALGRYSGIDQDRAKPLSILVKIIAKHLLGNEAILERSPRTIYNIIESSKQLFSYLANLHILSPMNPDGWFALPKDLTQEHFAIFFQSVNRSKIHDNTKWDRVRLIKEWYKLSKTGVLPELLALKFDPFDGKLLSDFGGTEVSQSCSLEDDFGWEPIPLEYAYPMVKKACEMLEEHGESMIELYRILNLIKIKQKAKKSKTHSISKRVFYGCVTELGVNIEVLEGRLPYLIDFNRYGKDPKKYSYSLAYKNFSLYRENLLYAATVIILMTTGMRSSEIKGLTTGCAFKDRNLDVHGLYRIRTTIRKTSIEYLKGKVIDLPIPKLTHLAVRIWETLGASMRRGNTLLTPMHSNEKADHVNDELTSSSIFNFVDRFAKYSNINYRPHPHQFRKTIAGWFVTNSPVLGPLLIMRLFSHSSLAMTEKYLRNNPIIQSARENMLLEQSNKLIDSITDSAVSGHMAGDAGDNLANAVLNDPIFDGLTGEDLGVTLTEYLRERALNGDLYFLMTPLAVCAYDPDDENDKPCVKALESSLNHDEALVRHKAVGNLPVTSRCKGVECSRCLVTKCQGDKIAKSLDFYRHVIHDAKDAGYIQNLHFVENAKKFVSQYQPVIEKIL